MHRKRSPGGDRGLKPELEGSVRKVVAFFLPPTMKDPLGDFSQRKQQLLADHEHPHSVNHQSAKNLKARNDKDVTSKQAQREATTVAIQPEITVGKQ